MLPIFVVTGVAFNCQRTHLFIILHFYSQLLYTILHNHEVFHLRLGALEKQRIPLDPPWNPEAEPAMDTGIPLFQPELTKSAGRAGRAPSVHQRREKQRRDRTGGYPRTAAVWKLWLKHQIQTAKHQGECPLKVQRG